MDGEGDKRVTEGALSTYLASLRAAKRLTLRQVEEATENAVSNAYLSQLEHGRIVNHRQTFCIASPKFMALHMTC